MDFSTWINLCQTGTLSTQKQIPVSGRESRWFLPSLLQFVPRHVFDFSPPPHHNLPSSSAQPQAPLASPRALEAGRLWIGDEHLRRPQEDDRLPAEAQQASTSGSRSLAIMLILHQCHGPPKPPLVSRTLRQELEQCEKLLFPAMKWALQESSCAIKLWC